MEQLVAIPIEDAIEGLDDVEKVQSTSADGTCLVRVEFSWSADPDRKYDETVREISALQPSLPAGLSLLEVQRIRTTEAAIVQVALTSNILPMRRLEKLAHRLRDRLNRVPGVRQATWWGAPQSLVAVSLDFGKLAQLQIPPTAVTRALRNAGTEGPIGAVHAGNRRFEVVSGGAFTNLDRIRNTPITIANGDVVHVKDVATVRWDTDEVQYSTAFNGQRALFVTATQKDSADVEATTAMIRSALTDFSKILPGDVKLRTVFMQDDNVEHRLYGLYRDFGIALFFVLLTLLPLGIRAGFIVALMIPFSLLLGLAGVEAAGYGLNQLSIAGFVVALGLLVDDSIVVIENISRRLRAGEDRDLAAIGGTSQIALAVLGCTACLMLAFLPLLALPGGSGAFIRTLPLTVLSTVAVSLFAAIAIVPVLARYLLPLHQAAEGNFLLRNIQRNIHAFYRPALHTALRYPWLALAVLALLCLSSYPMLGAIGLSLFPPADIPEFLIKIEMPDGAALSDTGRVLHRVENELKSIPEVAWFASNLGRGNPQIYYNVAQHDQNPAYAEILVGLHTWEPNRSGRTLERMRNHFRSYVGAHVTIVTFQNGTPVDAPIVLRVSGPDLSILRQIAGEVEAIALDTPGTRDVDNAINRSHLELGLGIDNSKAARLGIAAGAARQAVQLALTGKQAARFRDIDGDSYPVVVRMPMKRRNELSALSRIYVPAGGGSSAALGTIARPNLESGPAQIVRYNRERAALVTSYVDSNYLTSAVTKDVLQRVEAKLTLPPGYHLSLGGEAEEQSQGFAGLSAAAITALLGILTVLVLEFRSFRAAIVVAGIIPFGIFGAIAALYIFGYSLSFTAAIGIVALIGIEIKNSILLVDFTERLRDSGVELREAIEQAGEARFLPVLLTSVTAIAGLIPLAAENSGLFSPLATAIIGGLVASTLLSRIGTPVLYFLLAPDRSEKPPLLQAGVSSKAI